MGVLSSDPGANRASFAYPLELALFGESRVARRNLLCFGKAELQLQAEAEQTRLLVIRALSANEFLLGAFALILT